MTLRAPVVIASLLAWPLAAGAAVHVTVPARLSYDVGTVSVSETASGIGGGLGLRLAFGGQRGVWEVGAELDVAGYAGEGDGDPIFTGTVLVSRRGFASNGDVRGYWTVGFGIGGLAVGGSGLVLPLKVGAGASLGHGGPVGLQIGVFDRFNLVRSGGVSETLNNLGVEVALRLGR